MSLLINSDTTKLPFLLSESVYHLFPGSKIIIHNWQSDIYELGKDHGFDFRHVNKANEILKEVDTVINLWSSVFREYDYTKEFNDFINFCSDFEEPLNRVGGLVMNVFFMGEQTLASRLFYNGINTIIKQFHAVCELKHKKNELHTHYVMLELPQRMEEKFDLEVQNDIIDKFTKYRNITKSLMGQLYKID